MTLDPSQRRRAIASGRCLALSLMRSSTVDGGCAIAVKPLSVQVSGDIQGSQFDFAGRGPTVLIPEFDGARNLEIANRSIDDLEVLAQQPCRELVGLDRALEP
jgi:hypothetical protein